jgi:hypothetical protein
LLSLLSEGRSTATDPDNPADQNIALREGDETVPKPDCRRAV